MKKGVVREEFSIFRWRNLLVVVYRVYFSYSRLLCIAFYRNRMSIVVHSGSVPSSLAVSSF